MCAYYTTCILLTTVEGGRLGGGEGEGEGLFTRGEKFQASSGRIRPYRHSTPASGYTAYGRAYSYQRHFIHDGTAEANGKQESIHVYGSPGLFASVNNAGAHRRTAVNGECI